MRHDPLRCSQYGGEEMKALALLLCAPLCAGGIPKDKAIHVAAGAVAYVAVYEIAKYNDAKHPKLWGLGAALALGVAKEAFDKQHPKTHTCEAGDVAATFGGGLVASWVWRF